MQHLSAAASSHAYIRVLRRWWWLPIILMIVSGSLTYVGTDALVPKEYGSSIEVHVGQLNPVTPQDSPVNASTVAVEMVSTTVFHQAQLAIDSCKATASSHCPAALLDYNALWRRTTCAPDTTDNFVTCTTTSRDASVPPSVLNILAGVFINWNLKQLKGNYKSEIKSYMNAAAADGGRINAVKGELAALPAGSPEVTVLQEQINTLTTDKQTDKDSATNLRVAAQNAAGALSVISPAIVQKAPVSPHPLRNALLGAIVGIGLAAAMIVLLEYLDDTFRSTDEIVENTNLPLLGAVRKYEGTPDEMASVAARMPRTAIAEAYRVARANIQFTEMGDAKKIVLITSARDGEGKTTTANNLATTFALSGQRVLLVDGDLRRPGLTKLMGLRDTHGLSSALLDPDADVIRSTEVMGLSVVPSGAIPPNPSELLGSSRMRDFVENAAKNYDLVIIDTPPVLSVADTRILATLADGVILVLDPAITTRRMVRQARIAIENVGGRIIGVMLNRDVMRGEGYYYNYYYYEHRRDRGRAESERR